MGIQVLQEGLVREKQKLRQLHETTQHLAKLEEWVGGNNPLDNNDLSTSDSDSDSDGDSLNSIRRDTEKISQNVTRWNYNIFRPLSVYSKTYSTADKFLTDYDRLRKLYIQGLEYWPIDIQSPEEAMDNYDRRHTGIIANLNPMKYFKQSLDKLEPTYDNILTQFMENYNDDDGTIGRMVTENFLDPLTTLQDRLESLRTGLTHRTGSRDTVGGIRRRADQCSLTDPTQVDSIISNILTILSTIGPNAKPDGSITYNYSDIYEWLNTHQFLTRELDHAPNIMVIWETFLDDHTLHVPVSPESREYILSKCLPNDDLTLQQPASIMCDLTQSMNRQHFVNCRASGRSDSVACQNFCDNVATQPRNRGVFGDAGKCRSALDAIPFPSPTIYTRDCHDPDSRNRTEINSDLQRVKDMARQHRLGAEGVMVQQPPQGSDD
jgi:hypothetical protein